MYTPVPPAKRAFDIACIMLAIVLIAPALAICALAIMMTDGAPVFYRSRRRVFGTRSILLYKFRTMRRDAERLVNRSTVAVEGTRFLNIPIDSPLYTPAGRIIERFMLTEIPQVIHVLGGEMSLIGNRPLPENVIDALRSEHPEAESRFDVQTGLTGVSQLIGRDSISDNDRLRIEIAYCRSVMTRYSMMLDAKILFFTVMLAFSRRAKFTVDEVVAMLEKHSHGEAVVPSQSPSLQNPGGLTAT